MWVRSLGWEDSLEQEIATHSSILAWKIPWTEEPGRLQFLGLQRTGHDRATKHSTDDIYVYYEKRTILYPRVQSICIAVLFLKL